MKLKYEFVTMEMPDHTVAVPVNQEGTGFHGVIRMNDTMAVLLELLREDSTEDTLVEALQQRYEATEQELRESVQRILRQLAEADLLV